jgi:hypothetical protein
MENFSRPNRYRERVHPSLLSNNFSAEYGHGAGAVVSVLTRSGTNGYAGRAFYYHRDDAWDASSGAARPAVPTQLPVRFRNPQIFARGDRLRLPSVE